MWSGKFLHFGLNINNIKTTWKYFQLDKTCWGCCCIKFIYTYLFLLSEAFWNSIQFVLFRIDLCKIWVFYDSNVDICLVFSLWNEKMTQFFDFIWSNRVESSENYLNQIQQIYEIKPNQIKLKPNQANMVFPKNSNVSNLGWFLRLIHSAHCRPTVYWWSFVQRH